MATLRPGQSFGTAYSSQRTTTRPPVPRALVGDPRIGPLRRKQRDIASRDEEHRNKLWGRWLPAPATGGTNQ